MKNLSEYLIFKRVNVSVVGHQFLKLKSKFYIQTYKVGAADWEVRKWMDD